MDINIYKVIGNKAAVFAEVSDFNEYCDFELFLDGDSVSIAENKQAAWMFDISKAGSYTVKATDKGTLSLLSAAIVFSTEDIIPKEPEARSLIGPKARFAASEPVYDCEDKYILEVKINKGTFSQVQAVLDGLTDDVRLVKKESDLSSFSARHSIHRYEYYRAATALTREKTDELCRHLEGLENVIYCASIPPADAYRSSSLIKKQESIATPLASESVTPDYSVMQIYLNNEMGMNVRNAWKRGVTGEKAVIRHLDFGLYKNHENFKYSKITVVHSRDESEDCDHGTASVGCMVANNKGKGITGIAYNASLYFYDTDDMDRIVEQANPGDIVSLDIQISAGGYLLPIIFSKPWWDAIKNLTDKGAIVIAAAGNGGIDIGDPEICTDYGDCGVMLVGASIPMAEVVPPFGVKEDFSNYGHRNSLINSWGSLVTTTGYGDLQASEDHNSDYTTQYNGTSSATPLCSGALALLQSHAKKQGILLTPKSMKELIAQSSYAAGDSEGLGRRPNVDQLLTVIDRKLVTSSYNKNPWPAFAGFVNHNLVLINTWKNTESITFDYTNSNIIYPGVVTYYGAEGPTALEWYRYGETQVSLPVTDNNGNKNIINLQVSKRCGHTNFTMNSAADFDEGRPAKFDLVFKYDPKDNKHISIFSSIWKGTLPMYIQSWKSDYSLALQVNISII